MAKKLLDIVYVLKPSVGHDELRYSLRSVDKNFPHRKVWFVCGQPDGFVPDGRIIHTQSGVNKWDRIRSSVWEVVNHPEITDDFYLFNDDFFIMKKPTGKFVNFVDGSLDDRIKELRLENPWLNAYGRSVNKENEELKSLGISRHNFEVHMPMLINKELAKTSIYAISAPQVRSAYGNINKIPFIQHRDVKVYDMETVPEDPDYLSTNDNVFADGAVGKYIRGVFSEPSRFEV